MPKLPLKCCQSYEEAQTYLSQYPDIKGHIVKMLNECYMIKNHVTECDCKQCQYLTITNQWRVKGGANG